MTPEKLSDHKYLDNLEAATKAGHFIYPVEILKLINHIRKLLADIQFLEEEVADLDSRNARLNQELVDLYRESYE